MSDPAIASTRGDETPDRLGTSIPTGNLPDPEKQEKLPVGAEDEGEDIEDIDALIDDLESQDGEDEYGDDDAAPGSSARPVPEDLLQTNTRVGLTSAEVEQRRRKYGLNQMREEKENMILKFLMYFVGPIQFVMEVRCRPAFETFEHVFANLSRRLLLFSLPV